MKPKGALAILAFGKRGSEGSPEEESSESATEEAGEGDSFDSASESLFDQLGVPGDQRASAKTSLKAAIEACVRDYKSEG